MCSDLEYLGRDGTCIGYIRKQDRSISKCILLHCPPSSDIVFSIDPLWFWFRSDLRWRFDQVSNMNGERIDAGIDFHEMGKVICSQN